MNLQAGMPAPSFMNEPLTTSFIRNSGVVEQLEPGQGYTEAESTRRLEDHYGCTVCKEVVEETPLRSRACRKKQGNNTNHILCRPCFDQLTPTPRTHIFASGTLTKKCPTCREDLDPPEAFEPWMPQLPWSTWWSEHQVIGPKPDPLERIQDPTILADIQSTYQKCHVHSSQLAQPVPTPAPATVPIPAPATRRSATWSAGSIAREVFSLPFRITNTALNFGLFAGYYVTVMVGTTIAALTGIAVGIADAVYSKITNQQPRKTIKEYCISFAKTAFERLSMPYKMLPRHSHAAVLPALSSILFFALAVKSSSNSAPILGPSIYRASQAVGELTYLVSNPYKPVTDRTVNLFINTHRYMTNL